jgi:hypothetical protein
MAWAKFDDRWATHPKLLAAGLEAKGLDASGICYCAGQETDGFVPDTALVILGAGHRNPRKVADRLVEVGRWTRDDDRKGYVIHDFERYNFTRAQGEAKRTKDAERKAAARNKQGRDAKGRITSGQTDEDVRADSDPDPPGFREESARTPTPVPPVPTRPDPTTSEHRSSSSHHGVGDEPVEEEDLDVVDQALLAIATAKLERCLDDPEHKPINDRAGWLAAVVAKDRMAFGAQMSTMVAGGATVDLLVRTFDRQPAAAPSPSREPLPPAFVLNEDGMAVPVSA